MIQITRDNPFRKSGQWLKGSIHFHTTFSDGQVTPDHAMGVYKDHGYDFLAFGDHWRITMPQPPEGMLLIPGAEFNTRLNDDPAEFHFMAVGIEKFNRDELPKDPYQMAEALGKKCQLLIVAHPYWSSMTVDQLMRLRGVHLLEVYNNGCHLETGLGHSMYVWDQLLTRGRQWDALAADDAHWRIDDSCGGWVMVKAAARSTGDILAAMKAGEFYASSGPEILDVEFFGDRGIRVRCSPAQSVLFRCNGWSGAFQQAPDGRTITEAQWEVPSPANREPHRRVKLVRIEVTDPAGRKAWTNPFYLTGEP